MPRPDGVPDPAGRTARLIYVEPAPSAPGERAFGPLHHNVLLVLTALLFSMGSVLIWVFGYTFWVLLEALVRATGWGHGRSVAAPVLSRLTRETNILGAAEGWPLDAAIVLGVLATAGTLYLALDHLALLGNGRAQRRLARKTARLVSETPEARFFVELRPTEKRLRLSPDVGWLLAFGDRLAFVGDAQLVTLPRDQIGGVTVESSRLGLTGTWVILELAPPWGRLRLLARDDTATLSGTRRGAQHLAAGLTVWSASPTPPPV